MNCVHCAYDLSAHAIGDTCPECGRTITRFLRWTPWLKRLGPLAIASLVLVPLSLRFESMDPALPVWITAQSLIIVLGVVAIVQIRLAAPRIIIALGAVALSAMLPTLTLALFLTVFVFDGDLGLWLEPWPLLYFGNMASFVLALATLAAPPYRLRYVVAWAMPLLAMTSAALSVYFLGESIANA